MDNLILFIIAEVLLTSFIVAGWLLKSKGLYSLIEHLFNEFKNHQEHKIIKHHQDYLKKQANIIAKTDILKKNKDNITPNDISDLLNSITNNNDFSANDFNKYEKLYVQALDQIKLYQQLNEKTKISLQKIQDEFQTKEHEFKETSKKESKKYLEELHQLKSNNYDLEQKVSKLKMEIEKREENEAYLKIIEDLENTIGNLKVNIKMLENDNNDLITSMNNEKKLSQKLLSELNTLKTSIDSTELNNDSKEMNNELSTMLEQFIVDQKNMVDYIDKMEKELEKSN